MGTEMLKFGTSSRVGHKSDKFYERKMYSETRRNKPSKPNQEHEEKECSDDVVNRIYNHSSTDMHELPDNSVHLMITSPPYNVGKEYDDDLTECEYSDLLESVWRETHRVLAPGGRACINVANVGRKPYIPLNALISSQMVKMGYLMRGEIIWNKGASAGASCAWGSWKSASNPTLRDVHEYILIFSKGDYRRTSKDRESTISRDEFMECTKSIWSFPAESAKRAGHPAPFPVELPRRLIQLYSFANDIVLDPFIGSGSTAIAAKRNRRRYVGYEISNEYVNTCNRRLAYENESLFA